ncbi:hypothetical protein Lal_00040319 [Lupinus albus]|nr:hypothetical protein Lal_00040319 [Lupinus albus]
MLGLKLSPTVLAIRRTIMVIGSRRRLFVSSRKITQRDTVILIEPAMREAAPRTANNPWSIVTKRDFLTVLDLNQ